MGHTCICALCVFYVEDCSFGLPLSKEALVRLLQKGSHNVHFCLPQVCLLFNEVFIVILLEVSLLSFSSSIANNVVNRLSMW